jgi:hypothetical protein
MGVLTTINLNIVWVIALLLLVIIILSGVKVCDKKSIKEQTISKFIDTDYNMISEPFEDPLIAKFGELSQQGINKIKQKTLDQERKNLQINNLKTQIEGIESKILVLQQMM